MAEPTLGSKGAEHFGHAITILFPPHPPDKRRCLTYGMCWNAALVHGAQRARDGVDSLRQCALQRPSNAFSSCASAMDLPPSQRAWPGGGQKTKISEHFLTLPVSGARTCGPFRAREAAAFGRGVGARARVGCFDPVQKVWQIHILTYQFPPHFFRSTVGAQRPW